MVAGHESDAFWNRENAFTPIAACGGQEFHGEAFS